MLDYAGASLYRDDVDARYKREVTSGNPEYMGSVTGEEGLIDLVADVEGYTEANFERPPAPQALIQMVMACPMSGKSPTD